MSYHLLIRLILQWRTILNQNNLLFVTKKHTVIKLVYPYFKQGAIVSIIGIAGTIAWVFIIYFNGKRKKN